MAVNYFGKRRLEKIFFNYISDRKDLTKIVKKNLKELGKDFVFHYRKNRGFEWFKVSVFNEKIRNYLIMNFVRILLIKEAAFQ